jgi:hypothetical protein
MGKQHQPLGHYKDSVRWFHEGLGGGGHKLCPQWEHLGVLSLVPAAAREA